MRRFLTMAATATIATVVAAGAAPATVVTGEAPLVVEHAAVSTYSHVPDGVAVDRWSVWVCSIDPATDTTSGEHLSITPDEATMVLAEEIATYFLWLSDGRYELTFTAMDVLTPGPVPELGEAEEICREDAVAGSAGYQGAVVVTTVGDLGAEAVSGHEQCGGVVPCTASELPASDRRAVLGGGTLFDTTTYGPADLASAAHEFGHALDWNHANAGLFTAENVDEWGLLNDRQPADSRLSPEDLVFFRERILDPATPPAEVAQDLALMNGSLEYGDLTDVMGATPNQRPDAAPRAILQTMAFNRYAAGWIDPDKIATYSGGTGEVVLAPIGLDGVQMLVVPTDDPQEYFTLEARQATPYYPTDDHTGVIVHRIDQRPQVCGRTVEPCWGEQWNTQAVGGLPYGFGQVMDVDAVHDVGGVRVEVLAAHPDGTFTVRLGDAPVAPPAATPVPTAPNFTG